MTTTTVLHEPDPPPLPTPHFVGREDELEGVVGLLVSEMPSTILLYGSGGIGKTGAPRFAPFCLVFRSLIGLHDA